MALLSMEKIRNVEWGRTFLWEIKFDPPPPAPFDSWFPATEVTEPTAELVSHQIEVPGTTIKIPHRSTPFDLSITFLDDIKHTLRKWLEEWINKDILGDGKSIQYLTKSCRSITIHKLNLDRTIMSSSTYSVFPEGQVKFEGNSNSDIVQHQMTFHIAGNEVKNSQLSYDWTPADDNGFDPYEPGEVGQNDNVIV